MKYLLIASLAFPYFANSAEFTLGGAVIKSSMVVKEKICSGYSILLKQNRFPDQVAGQVPTNYAHSDDEKGFPGYAGGDADLILSSKPYLKIGAVEHDIPLVIEKYIKSGKFPADDDRVYIPVDGFCLSSNTFLLLMDSGGNCNICDVLIKYQINKDGSIKDIGFPTQKDHKQALGY